MASSGHRLHKTLRHGSVTTSPIEYCDVYILVMGLTGAGKSTFISRVTEDDSIPIGQDDDMDGVTQEVQDYVLLHTYGSVHYQIHLIDSPGFDDGAANDAEVLSRIATYINTIYKLKQTIAGVLYLHDITKAKMGGVGIRNLRMLEKMVGVDRWDNCTLVTTKWGCTSNPQAEALREQKLQADDKYFKSMCQASKHARMARFSGTKASALNIIRPHLGRKFSPEISLQMVDPDGPRLKLGDTDAGRVVAEGVEKLLIAQQRTAEVEALNKILEQKFDENLFRDFKQKRDRLQRKHGWNRAGRWAVRTAIVGGGIAATVVTLGPGASAFVLEPAFEKAARLQKKGERDELAQLQADYQAESQHSQKLSRLGSQWLANGRVKELRHLDSSDEHPLSGASSSRTSLDGEQAKEGLVPRRHRRASMETTASSITDDVDAAIKEDEWRG